MKKIPKQKRITVGEQYLSVAYKDPDSRDPIELQREMQKEYVANLKQAVYDFRKKIHGDFYVIQLTKREQLLKNILRNYFFGRMSCPTPEYDQSVFFYDAQKEHIEYLWTVPDRETCILMRENAAHVPPEERELLYFVLKFWSGDLLLQAKARNGEQKNSPLLNT